MRLTHSICIIGLLFSFFLYSCKASEENKMEYKVTGLGDVTISSDEAAQSYGEVSKISGTPQIVRVRVSSAIPPGVRIHVVTPQDLVPFTFPVQFSAGPDAVLGTYPYTITTSTDGQPDQSYSGNITVLQGRCTGALITKYIATDSCGGSSNAPYLVEVEGVAETKNRLRIRSFRGIGDVVYADLQCPTSTINISSQEVAVNNDIVSISGKGTYTTGPSGKINITYSMVANGVTKTCSIAMARK